MDHSEFKDTFQLTKLFVVVRTNMVLEMKAEKENRIDVRGNMLFLECVKRKL